MKRVQTVLGGHQDAIVARGVARDLGISAHLAGENAFSYGLLYERETERAERLKQKANDVWACPTNPAAFPPLGLTAASGRNISAGATGPRASRPPEPHPRPRRTVPGAGRRGRATRCAPR